MEFDIRLPLLILEGKDNAEYRVVMQAIFLVGVVVAVLVLSYLVIRFT